MHKAVLKGKRVHDDEIIPVPNEIRDHNKKSTDTWTMEGGVGKGRGSALDKRGGAL